jgi:hypothetical protein
LVGVSMVPGMCTSALYEVYGWISVSSDNQLRKSLRQTKKSNIEFVAVALLAGLDRA